jgi:hypothetical protein
LLLCRGWAGQGPAWPFSRAATGAAAAGSHAGLGAAGSGGIAAKIWRPFTVDLANGQQWQQLSGDTSLAHWTKPAATYSVRITHGALRSLNLKVKGEPVSYKVEQIK